MTARLFTLEEFMGMLNATDILVNKYSVRELPKTNDSDKFLVDVQLIVRFSEKSFKSQSEQHVANNDIEEFM